MRTVLVLASTLFLTACGTTVVEQTGTDTPVAEACPGHPEYPEYPSWNVNVDFIEIPWQPSPEEAVRTVAGDQIEVRAVRTSGRSSEVEVRLGSDEGVFFVQQVERGWLVDGGDGCAAMPAYEVVGGPEVECPGPPTPPSHLEEGDTFIVACTL